MNHYLDSLVYIYTYNIRYICIYVYAHEYAYIVGTSNNMYLHIIYIIIANSYAQLRHKRSEYTDVTSVQW